MASPPIMGRWLIGRRHWGSSEGLRPIDGRLLRATDLALPARNRGNEAQRQVGRAITERNLKLAVAQPGGHPRMPDPRELAATVDGAHAAAPGSSCPLAFLTVLGEISGARALGSRGGSPRRHRPPPAQLPDRVRRDAATSADRGRRARPRPANLSNDLMPGFQMKSRRSAVSPTPWRRGASRDPLNRVPCAASRSDVGRVPRRRWRRRARR